ncbi:MAG: hypothetical protein E6Q61_03135 [Nitrosomonas sp.]|nr:MAG: hypothetical protein E6Q61_03135 [Nitrosomonas sp.]HMU63694.1 hypothetical protein [Nitrosomonas sp.]HMV11430.1 hypothetical protein [Nitrosomonas sp.]HMW19756.1 hypothetical protein [Nitrosomonas sp.]HMW68411.1 hypothetical protein [Nitrosomonas sp.]
MDRELSFDADNFDLDLSELKELEDIVADGMIPDSRIVKIIDEIEFAKEDNFDVFEDLEDTEISLSRFNLD